MEMLSFWKDRWTTQIRDDIEALGLDGYQSLHALGQLIRHRNAAGYDVAIRSWALHDPLAQKVVAEADHIRLSFIQRQFEKLGFEGLELENRSRLYLYYAMSEPTFFAPVDNTLIPQLAELRLRFLTAKT